MPEAEVQAILKPWVGRPVNFDDLQKACDAVMDFHCKGGYTVQAILPPQKTANGCCQNFGNRSKAQQCFC